jgi:hypothetical protein
MQTPEDYYSDQENWGNYQFITLKQFIDEFMVETTDPDSYLNNTPRSKIVTQSKIGIRTLNREIKKTVLAIEMTVGPDMYLPLPQDYVDWVRVSVVTADGKLKALNINVLINRAIGYLQDDTGEILFDEQGQILQADGTNYIGKPYRKYKFTDYFRGKNFELDTSVLSRWGEFLIDEERGTIAFSSNLEGKEIVLEYISDGLQMYNLREEDITIHKDLVETLSDWVYSECISKRRHVPANEKDRARKRYKTTLHKCKIDSADFDINQMFRLKSAATKQL